MDKDKMFEWECIVFGKEEAHRRQRVRNRVSYREWKNLMKEIQGKTPREIMWIIFNFMDRKKAFGFATQADYAQESLELFLEDLGGERK